MKTSIFFIGLISFFLIQSCKDKDHGVLPPPDRKGNVVVENGIVTVNPIEYEFAIRNPMKGFREYFGPGYDKKRDSYPYPYGSIIKEYMQWNMLEDKATDGVEKIEAYSNHRWEGVEDINVKIIPRIFVVWMEPWHGGYAKNTYTSNPDDLNGWHWPSDMIGETYSEDPNTPIQGGYFASNFQDRVKALVAKAGEAWDNDPRVAYVEMGIIGEWGEHHDPDITTYWAPHDQPNHVDNRTWIPGIEKVLGDAFTSAFKNKKVMVRYAYDFKDYDFGIYWDSWAQPEEDKRGFEEMLKLGNRWKTQPIGGEITWNWGGLNKYHSFEEVVGNGTTRDIVIQQIRDLHANHLGGITWANFDDPKFIPNADLIQKSLGYRFKLSNFSYPSQIKQNETFKISFDIQNVGSSPFYYDWPVEIALLNKETHQKVWSKVLNSAKVSQWMPGDKWNKETNSYKELAAINRISESMKLDNSIQDGIYIISVSVLDPAGMLPSLRFAVQNYFEGGRHPLGFIGVNAVPNKFEISSSEFMDLKDDKTLHYELN